MMIGKFALAAVATAIGFTIAAPAQANWLNDRFKFEFNAGAVTPHVGTDLHNSHYTDFRHYNDYYRHGGGFERATSHTNCVETTGTGANGQAQRRIVCEGRRSGPVGQ